MSRTDSVRELREQTGAGVLDCRKALEAAAGNVGQAKEILKKQGYERAAKRAERVARQGLIGMAIDPKGRGGVLVKLLCETDFVARTPQFRDFLNRSVMLALERGIASVPALLQEKDQDQTLQDRLSRLIAQIGENIVVAALGRLEAAKADEQVGGYLHMGDQVGSLVLVRGLPTRSGPVTQGVLKDILLHITAMQPLFVGRDSVPVAMLSVLRETLTREANQSGKPVSLVEKIVQGKLDKRLAEICLVDQPFVRDPSGKTTMAVFLRTDGQGAEVLKFIRFQVGGTSHAETKV